MLQIRLLNNNRGLPFIHFGKPFYYFLSLNTNAERLKGVLAIHNKKFKSMRRFIITLAACLSAGVMFGQIQFTDINPDAVVTGDLEMGYPISVSVGNQNPSETQFYVQNYWEYASSYIAVFGTGASVVVTNSNVFGAGLVTLLSERTEIGSNSNWSAEMFPVLHDPDEYTTWVGQTGYAGFKVQFGSNIYYGWIKLSANNDKTFTVYEYAVETTAGKAIAAGDKVGSSSIVSIKTNNLTLYPNPVSERLTIDLPEGAEQMTICDITGKEIISFKAESSMQTIDVSNLTAGTYLLKVRTQSGISTKKIIIR